jgi:hypothetical protein
MPKRTLKTFNVDYWIEQGFAVNVQAHTEDEAVALVAELLDEESGQLPHSERVHYDGGVNNAIPVAGRALLRPVLKYRATARTGRG